MSRGRGNSSGVLAANIFVALNVSINSKVDKTSVDCCKSSKSIRYPTRDSRIIA